MRVTVRIRAGVVAALVAAGPHAVMPGAQPADNRPPALLEPVGIDQRLGAAVPLDLALVDATGATVRMGDVVGGRPAILVLAYYRCPMLCPLVLDGVARTLRAVALAPGDDYTVIVVSIDPTDDAARAAAAAAELAARDPRVGAPGAWHFLTGSAAAVGALAEAVGFRYRHDPASDQYAHASGLMVLTPEGRVSRYFYGLDYAPRDVRLGLVEASAGAIGTLADQVLLFCYHYDPATGRYSLAVLQALRVAGVATVLALGAFMVVMLRRDRRAAGTGG